MSSKSTLNQKKFWEVLKYLIELDREESFNSVCRELSLSPVQLSAHIAFLREVSWPIALEGALEDKTLVPPLEQERPKVALEFSLLEWLQFQACFPKISEEEGKPYYEDVKNKLLGAELNHEQLDLFGPASKLEQALSHDPAFGEAEEATLDRAFANDIVSFIEEAVFEQACLLLAYKNGQNSVVFPRKVVFLDGALALVGEEVRAKRLLYIPIEDIAAAREEEMEWTKLFTGKEIDDFIQGLRAVGESEIRLVLKVYSRERFNSNLSRQFFGNQCMVTNPQGDFIWAASIEPSEQIFEWLQELGSDVEILDPASFKKDFLKYCEASLKKLA